MSTEHSAFPEEDARQEAERILRFKIGTQYSLGEHYIEDSEHVFPIVIHPPRVIFNETRSEPVDVKYLDPREVGEIRIDGSGEVDYTLPQTVYSNVRKYEKEIQTAVEKALVNASAKDFTKLPFPENRYAPVEDLLSEVILMDSISEERIAEFESPKGNDEETMTYWDYVSELEEMDLLRRRNGSIEAGNILVSIQRDTDKHHEALNTALARFFREKISDISEIHVALGPYLAIAGFYYRLAIESDSLPIIEETRLREAFERHYKGKGKKTKEKTFKMSRYLLHLERAGILKCITESNRRMWTGNKTIKSDLMDETDYLATVGVLN
jgi:hypothetical protein